MRNMGNFLAKLWSDESGISPVEYVLLLASIAAGIIVAAELLNAAIGNQMISAAACMETGDPSSSC